ncbi:MAG: hypothetical protein NC087_01975 [Anaeroplasma bactoclasticum]|nr:hypothetical protein [Anaeroplasma bactoclasticum]
MNGYYPYGGNYYTTPTPQPTGMPNYNPNPVTQPQMKWYAEVDGLEGAKTFRCNPGMMTLLMDSHDPVCYRKQVNQYGDTILFETYDLVLRKGQESEKVEYITKQEFDKELSEIRALLKKEE